MSTKPEIARSTKERLGAARAAVTPQWKKCFWTRPFGHIRDGSDGFDSLSIFDVCLYCGKPSYVRENDARRFERIAAEAGRYPIALEADKRVVA